MIKDKVALLTWGEEFAIGFEDEVAEPVSHLIDCLFSQGINHKASIIKQVRQASFINPKNDVLRERLLTC